MKDNEALQPNNDLREYSALEQVLAARETLHAPEDTPERVMARIELLSQTDAFDQVLSKRPPLKAPSDMASRVLARLQTTPQTVENLEAVLAKRPFEQAPRKLSANVLAAIATVPQEKAVTEPVIKYYPPIIKPAQVYLAIEDSSWWRQLLENRLLRTVVITSVVATFLMVLGYLLYPLFTFWVAGYPTEPDMIARLEFLRSAWENIANTLSNAANALVPILPTILSMIAGVTALVIIFNNVQRTRAWRE
jgi:hypothetical protein